ncbi:nucleoside diphosphate-linked moiety X motif 17 [Sceloporus undulatus]|uniref:nucleoside diphosphate-linked moiety X motif 17 n=1 Tax=Sceloporus undulatus TaxID=8520 RepID=UPI001C4AABF4|nr:nucleoside diphosphate-linked moiety X motif 17 [Sceloporus undulatus]
MLVGKGGMETLRRVLVHLSKENSCPQSARFQQSIVGHFSRAHEDSSMVNYGLDQNRLLISDQEFLGSRTVLLKRPSFCPIKLLRQDQADSLPAKTQVRGVDVGVAVLLQSSGRRILLTRRSKALSLFPNVWVPPGGHVEPNEQLLDAGLRELQEETGLRLSNGEIAWQTLGLWESVYPPLLSRGLPTHHHVVVYMLLRSPESHQQLETRFNPSEAEVSACAWLDPKVLAAIAATEDGIGTGGQRKVAEDIPPMVSITEFQNGCAKTVPIPTATFLNTAPAQGRDVERVSTGTKFALRMWLEALGGAS